MTKPTRALSIKELPILFSTAMVQALLDNRKTQTRRVIRIPEQWMIDDGWAEDKYGEPYEVKTICPYGQVGDRLWVRETWAAIKLVDSYKPSEIPLCNQSKIWYKADPQYPPYEINPWLEGNCGKWRPGRFMPRWASRITLEITGKRVQRVQEISAWDCITEGLLSTLREHDACVDLKNQYHALWDSINAKPRPHYSRNEKGELFITHYESYPWEAGDRTETYRGLLHYIHGNPWVGVIEFKRVESGSSEVKL